MAQTIRLATRGSAMALWQANHVKQLLEQQHDVTVDIIPVSTPGDQNKVTPLAELGGKQVFVKTIQRALLSAEADIAVHSVKDMSVYPTPDLSVAAILARTEARDALLTRGALKTLDQLATGSVIGTGSPRRQALLKHYYPELETAPIRGNADTRIAKLQQGDYDAILLSYAGLSRITTEHPFVTPLSPNTFIPAIGQGAIAIECKSDSPFAPLIYRLNDNLTHACVTAEQAVNQILGGDCHSAVGAYACYQDHLLTLQAVVGCEQSGQLLTTTVQGELSQALSIGAMAADNLLANGAGALLHD